MRPRPRSTLVALAACVALGAGGIVACQKAPKDVANGDDPIAALKVSTESTRYNQGYWRAQMESPEPARQQLWTQAYSYCNRKDLEVDGAKPNCRGVMTAAAMRRNGSAATGGQSF